MPKIEEITNEVKKREVNLDEKKASVKSSGSLCERRKINGNGGFGSSRRRKGVEEDIKKNDRTTVRRGEVQRRKEVMVGEPAPPLYPHQVIRARPSGWS